MNSKQGARYIKSRMGNELKRQILVRGGIMPEDGALVQKPTVLNCSSCELVNAIQNKYYSKCSYPSSVNAYEELKAKEEQALRTLEEKHVLFFHVLTSSL